MARISVIDAAIRGLASEIMNNTEYISLKKAYLKFNSKIIIRWILKIVNTKLYYNMDGAQGETRTLTISLPADFESAASTIPPLGLNIRKIFLLALRFLPIKKSIVSYKNK